MPLSDWYVGRVKKEKTRFDFYVRGLKLAASKAGCLVAQWRNTLSDRYAIEDAIIISGMGRGGTTWLTEVFSTIPGSGVIWEPLHPIVLRNHHSTRRFQRELGNYPYIEEDADWPEAERFFWRLLSGKLLFHEYVKRNMFNPRLARVQRWIIKFCRANMLLPWLVRKCPVRPIYLLCHPCAVVSSQLRHYGFDVMSDHFNIPDTRYTKIYRDHRHILPTIKTREQRLAAWWAFDNLIPLQHPANGTAWITVAYEQLLMSPLDVFSELFSRMGCEVPANMNVIVNKPSRTTDPRAAIAKGQDQLTSWKSQLSDDQINQILDVVHRFGITAYTDAPEPNYTELGAIMTTVN